MSESRKLTPCTGSRKDGSPCNAKSETPGGKCQHCLLLETADELGWTVARSGYVATRGESKLFYPTARELRAALIEKSRARPPAARPIH